MTAAQKFTRGQPFVKKDVMQVKDLRARKILKKDAKAAREAISSAAAAEILLTQSAGFLEPENDLEKTFSMRQDQLKELVDVQSSKKIFDLKLEEGPYGVSYTRNGRHVLIGGEKGHLAGFDWQTGKVRFEVNLEAGEHVYDVTWLQNETFFAAAQKKYVYIYDHIGTEVHRLKKHSTATRLDFLPYHFLLMSTGRDGQLRYQDVSTGSLVAEIPFYGTGACTNLTHNPRNGIAHLGHANGTVTLWSPTVNVPLVKMLCHRGPVNAATVDVSGNYMVTAGADGQMKVWDLRTYQELAAYHTTSPASSLSLSQKGVLAVGHGPRVTLWKDICSTSKQKSPYMNHLLPGQTIHGLQFCPFEDVLGVGHSGGFSSILVPGSGEANYDSYEANPYATSKQRREGEVKQLLDKLQPDTIVLDPDFIGRVHRPAQSQIEEDRAKERAANVQFNDSEKSKNKARGRNSAMRRYQRKRRNIVDDRKHEAAEKAKVEVIHQDIAPASQGGSKSALSRFIKKSA